jgi:hypothetical protein
MRLPFSIGAAGEPPRPMPLSHVPICVVRGFLFGSEGVIQVARRSKGRTVLVDRKSQDRICLIEGLSQDANFGIPVDKFFRSHTPMLRWSGAGDNPRRG